jgi:hypothetical protein
MRLEVINKQYTIEKQERKYVIQPVTKQVVIEQASGINRIRDARDVMGEAQEGYILSWNDTEKKFEYIPNTGGVLPVVEEAIGTINGINPTFSASNAWIPESVVVYRNGQKVNEQDYSKISPTSLTLVTVPQEGEIIELQYIRA